MERAYFRVLVRCVAAVLTLLRTDRHVPSVCSLNADDSLLMMRRRDRLLVESWAASVDWTNWRVF